MKKTLLLLIPLFVCTLGYAQPKIGLTVSPGLSYGRTNYLPQDDSEVLNDGVAFRAKFGLEFDFPITANYSFNTGLLFAPKKVTVSAVGFNEFTTSLVNQTEEYKLQYLQIPTTLKLYTNEISPDIRLFFQLGFMAEILLFSEPFEREYVLVDQFRFFDISFTGGIGVEYGAGINSILYAGIFYDRGLVNIISEQNNDIVDDLGIRMDMFHLKIGIKF